MKAMLMVWAVMMGAAVFTRGAETNLVTFETLSGKRYEGVRIVSTNADGLVLKVPGVFGWVKEGFTNLPVRMRPRKVIQIAGTIEDARLSYLATNLSMLQMRMRLEALKEQPNGRRMVEFMDSGTQWMNDRAEALSKNGFDQHLQALEASREKTFAGWETDEKLEKRKVDWEYYQGRMNITERDEEQRRIEKSYERRRENWLRADYAAATQAMLHESAEMARMVWEMEAFAEMSLEVAETARANGLAIDPSFELTLRKARELAAAIRFVTKR